MTNQEEAKMTQEQVNPTKQDNIIEITKARSRVTANTPAILTSVSSPSIFDKDLQGIVGNEEGTKKIYVKEYS